MARQARNLTRDNPEVRREQILEEAISILGRLGYHGFTIHELAERCGLSNAGLLYHFPSKNQLFVAVVQELEQREIRALALLIAEVERDERMGVPLTAIIDLLHAIVAVVVPAKALAAFQAYGEFALDLRKDDVFWCAADPGWAYKAYCYKADSRQQRRESVT